MFNVTGAKLVIILLVALVVLGPDKLPQAVRNVARLYGELRRVSDGFQSEIRNALDEPTRQMRDTVDMAKTTFASDEAGPRPASGRPESKHSGPAPPDTNRVAALAADEHQRPRQGRRRLDHQRLRSRDRRPGVNAVELRAVHSSRPMDPTTGSDPPPPKDSAPNGGL